MTAEYQEPNLKQIEAEAEALRIGSGFKLTADEARDRVVGTMGWVSYQHCLKCKAMRGVA